MSIPAAPANPGTTPPPATVPFTSPLALAVMAAIGLALAGGLAWLGTRYSANPSSYPTLVNAVGYGNFTGSTDVDTVFYLTCVEPTGHAAMMTPGFYKVVDANSTFILSEVSGTRRSPPTRVSVRSFIIYAERSHWSGYLIATPTGTTVTNGPTHPACSGAPS